MIIKRYQQPSYSNRWMATNVSSNTTSGPTGPPEFGLNSTSTGLDLRASYETLELRASYETVLAAVCLLIIMVVALVGNVAVIAGIRLQHTLRADLSNLLIINLSITDLTSTILVMLSAFVSIVMGEWPFGRFWCDCVCALNYCLIIVSMLTLCCISIDRFQAVMHPLSYESRMTRKRIIAVIVYAWIQGLVFGMAPALSDWVSYDYWEGICAIQWHLYRPGTVIYVVTAFVCCFLGPGIVLVYCYVKILKEVKKQKLQVLAMQTHNSARRKVDKSLSDKTRLVWSLLIVVFAYFICTAPFSITKLIKVSVDEVGFIPGPINLVSSLLGYIASAINPLIYGIFRRDFRNAYIRVLKRICIQKCSQYAFFNSDTNPAGAKKTNSYWSEYDNLTLNKTNVDADMKEIQKAMNQTQTSISQINISANTNATDAIEERPLTPQLLNNDAPAANNHTVFTNIKNGGLQNGAAFTKQISTPGIVEIYCSNTDNQPSITVAQHVVNEAQLSAKDAEQIKEAQLSVKDDEQIKEAQPGAKDAEQITEAQPSANDAEQITEAQPSAKDAEQSSGGLKDTVPEVADDTSEVEAGRTEAHHQIIVVQSLAEVNERSKY